MSCHNYFLIWFDPVTENMVDEESLEITDSQVGELFSDERPYIGSHPLTAFHRKEMQKFAQHEINLNDFDYFVEAKTYERQ